MPAKLTIAPTIHSYPIQTVNLGGDAAATRFTSAEVGKAVKLTGPDTFGLCAAGDDVEAIVTSVEQGTRGGYTIGGIVADGYVEVVSTAALAFGDFVVAAAQPAVGTPVSGIGANDLPAVPVQKAAAAPTGRFALRIVGLGRAGTGAAGTICVAQFV